MARHQYQPRRFLRDAPNALLARYFQDRGLLQCVDFGALKDETNIEPVYAAWQDLPPDDLRATEASFRAIDSMSVPEAVAIVVSEASQIGESLAEDLSQMEGLCHKMLWTYIEKREIFERAYLFFEAGNLSRRFWRKRKVMPVAVPGTDEPSLRLLEEEIGRFFRENEGRGRHCKVEMYDRAETLYLFVYVEDFADKYTGFDHSGQFERRTVKPAFEIVFVYSASEGWLDTFFRGSADALTTIQRLFSECILGAEPQADPRMRVYELNGLKRRDFQFVYSPESGIADVRIRRLRLTVRGGPLRRITLEADPSDDRHEIYDLMDRTLVRGGISVNQVNVTQARLVVTFHGEDGKRGTTRTFDVSYPNSCPLRYDGRDRHIRQCLVLSGIDESASS